MTEEYKEEAIFNQAVFQQRRLHDLFSDIDILSRNPLGMDPESGQYHYQIIIMDLFSIFCTIAGKLSEKELEDTIKKQEELKNFEQKHQIFTIIYDGTGKKGISKNISAWNTLFSLIFQFRLELERLSEVHGLGNPSKKDPKKAMGAIN